MEGIDKRAWDDISLFGQAVTLRLTLGDSLMVTKAVPVCRPGDVRLIDGRGSGNNAGRHG